MRRSPEQRPPPRALPLIFVTGQARKENGSPVRRHGTAGPESVSPTETSMLLTARSRQESGYADCFFRWSLSNS